MSDFDLGARYDVVLCLFSSIGYLPEGKRVVYHELALYTREEVLGLFAQAGLAVTHDREGIFGRGLYVARPAG